MKPRNLLVRDNLGQVVIYKYMNLSSKLKFEARPYKILFLRKTTLWDFLISAEVLKVICQSSRYILWEKS